MDKIINYFYEKYQFGEWDYKEKAGTIIPFNISIEDKIEFLSVSLQFRTICTNGFVSQLIFLSTKVVIVKQKPCMIRITIGFSRVVLFSVFG